mgnify:CR=1 FL=1
MGGVRTRDVVAGIVYVLNFSFALANLLIRLAVAARIHFRCVMPCDVIVM